MRQRVLALLDRRPRLALAAYGTLAFVATHVPPPTPIDDEPGPPVGLDKAWHFGGFAVLAFLLANALHTRFPPKIHAFVTFAVCAAYGVVDELTQPPFGRTADPLDWVADLLGAAVGVAAHAWWRGRRAGNARAANVA